MPGEKDPDTEKQLPQLGISKTAFGAGSWTHKPIDKSVHCAPSRRRASQCSRVDAYIRFAPIEGGAGGVPVGPYRRGREIVWCRTSNVSCSSESQLLANASLVPGSPESLAPQQLIDFQSVLRSSKRDEVLWEIRF